MFCHSKNIRVLRCALAMAFAVSLPSSILAENSAPADTVYVVPKIVVKAKRTDPNASLFGRSGFVAMVDVRPRKARVEDLSLLLSQLVGVRTKQYGGLGSFATVSIRGSSSSQVAVYLDGIPVNDPYLGVTNIADLPLGSVQRVEVYRGFSPVHLGGSAIGGAINLITSDDAVWGNVGPVPRAEIHTSIGSFGTRRNRGAAWLHAGALRVFLSGGDTDSNGDFPFLDDNGTPIATSDDRDTTRVNNDTESYNFLAKTEISLEGVGTFIATHDVFKRKLGVPGIGAFQSGTARAERSRQLTHVNFESKLLASQLRVGTTAFYSRSNEMFKDSNRDLSLTTQDTDNTIDVYGGRTRLRWYIPRLPLLLDASFESRKEQYKPINNVPTLREGPNQWRRSETTGLTGEIYLFRQTLVLSASGRWQRSVSDYVDAPFLPFLPPTPQGRRTTTSRSPSAGARWQVVPAVTVKANAGRYFRYPTFIELFGNVGSVTGNPGLRPETGTNRDIGVVFKLDESKLLSGGLIEVTYLDNKVDSLILFFPNSQYTSRPTNISSARIRGWEFSASSFFAGRYHMGLNYTYMDTEDTSDIPYYNGNALPSRPRHNFNLSLTSPLPFSQLTYEFHHLGKNFIDQANLQEVSKRDFHNLILAITPARSRLSLLFEGRNLTDNQISDISGFPLPGRSFYSTLTLSFTSRKAYQQ